MDIEIRPAADEVEREAAYRLRYRIYVEEMNRYRGSADHERKLLVEEDDAKSRIYVAVNHAGEIVGTMRWTWGGDAPFSERVIEQYRLPPFLTELPAVSIIVGERFMVSAAMRGSDLLFRMFCTYLEFVNARRIELIFGDCEPHLLNLYIGLGFRSYTRRNVNSAETGYLIPLVMVAEDVAYMRQIGSPLAHVLKDFGAAARVPPCAARLLEEGSAISSQRLSAPEQYWAQIRSAMALLGDGRPTLFDGLSEAEAQATVGKSNIISCETGDRVIKKGNPARNMYVVLSGTLEVRDGNSVVAVLAPGDVFGEMAFLLDCQRTMDVYAVSDDVRILSLSEATLRSMIERAPEAAAKLLLNLSKMLCLRLLRRV
jgi:hypothetical protein